MSLDHRPSDRPLRVWNMRREGKLAPCWAFWDSTSGAVGGVLAAIVTVGIPGIILVLIAWFAK